MRMLIRQVGVALLLVALTNCTAWRSTQAPMTELVGKKIRLTTTDGDKTTGVLINADSVGFVVLRSPSYKSRALAIDTTTIVVTENRAISPVGTIAAVSVIVLLGVLCVAVIGLSEWDDESWGSLGY